MRRTFRTIKFFLHLSEDEQRKCFIARIDEHDKNWKSGLGEVRERKHRKDCSYEEISQARRKELQEIRESL